MTDRSFRRSLLAAAAASALALQPALPVALPARAADGAAKAHAEAVAMARAGNAAGALVILERLHQENPTDLSIAEDELVVAEWAGHPQEALDLFKAMPRNRPAYVLQAVAAAERSLKRWDDSVKHWQDAEAADPQDQALAAGEIRTLADAGKAKAAMARADAALRRFGAGPAAKEVLLAAGYAAAAGQRPVDAFRFYDRVHGFDPSNAEAERGRILAIADMGAPHQALERLDHAPPGTANAAERRRIEESDAAESVRFGEAEPPSEKDRYVATDAAIAQLDGLIKAWSTTPGTAGDVLRARFDRIVALRDRKRMKDVRTAYEALVAQKVAIPPYVEEAAADAYLYLREPEKAEALYKKVLAAEPKSHNAAVGLYFSLIDLEHFDEAKKVIDTLDKNTGKWIWLRGAASPMPNDDKEDVVALAASERLYAGDLAEADRLYKALVDAAPGDAGYHENMGRTDAARGWPRKAAEEYDIGLGLKPKDPGIQTAKAKNDMRLQEWGEAGPEVADLGGRFPEDTDVQALQRAWDLHNRPELTVDAGRTLQSPTDARGGNGVFLETDLYSPPFLDDWRLFAGSRIANEQEPEGEVTLRTQKAGVQYRQGPWSADVTGSWNDWGTGERRAGAAADGSYALNDQWSVRGDAESFSTETPLRALKNGVTASSADAGFTWRQDESRKFDFDASGMKFSDGNDEAGVNGVLRQRVFTTPHIAVDVLGGAALSDNTKPGGPYYSPARDAYPNLGLDATQILYRRYEFVWSHELTLTAGPYWEQAYGVSGAGTVGYKQRLQLSEAFDTSLGASWSRQSYDGQYQNSLNFLFGLDWKF